MPVSKNRGSALCVVSSVVGALYPPKTTKIRLFQEPVDVELALQWQFIWGAFGRQVGSGTTVSGALGSSWPWFWCKAGVEGVLKGLFKAFKALELH